MPWPDRQGAQPPRMELIVLWLLAWAGLTADPLAIALAAWPARLQGLRAWLPAAAGVWAAVALARRGGLRRGPLAWMLAYAVAGLCGSLLVSPRPLEACYWGVSFAAVGCIAAYSLSRADGAHTLWQMTCLIITWLGLGAWFLAMIAAPGATLHGIMTRLPSVWGQPMIRETGIGRYLAVISVLCLCRAIWVTPGPRRSLWAALAATLMAAVAASASRSAVLGLAAACVWLALPALARRPAWGIAAGLLAAVGAAVLLRYGRMPSTVFDLLSGRTWLWTAAVELLRDSVWIGHGFHADRYWLAWPFRNHISGAVLHAATQAGILGVAAFVAAWLGAWRRAAAVLRAPQSRPVVEAGAVLALLTARSVFESTGAFYGVDWLLLASVFARLGMA